MPFSAFGPAGSGRTAMKHILIVDDDEAIRGLLLSFLHDKGYEADAAVDGESALEWLAGNRTDMVLLDIRMPGMSGIDVLQHTAKLYPDLPVIVISGYADEATAREALQMGAYDFFLKPFDLRTVERRLTTKLGIIDLAGEA
jgi:DNA-binding NtrC family response regulator